MDTFFNILFYSIRLIRMKPFYFGITLKPRHLFTGVYAAVLFYFIDCILKSPWGAVIIYSAIHPPKQLLKPDRVERVQMTFVVNFFSFINKTILNHIINTPVYPIV